MCLDHRVYRNSSLSEIILQVDVYNTPTYICDCIIYCLRLCQVEIAKRTAAYTKIVCELRMNLIGDGGMMDMPHPFQEISHTLLPLPLPSDAILSEFHHLLHPKITELVI